MLKEYEIVKATRKLNDNVPKNTTDDILEFEIISHLSQDTIDVRLYCKKCGLM